MAPDVEHLLPGVRRGDPAAFEALVRAMTPALYGYAAGMLHDPDAAEEIAQRTLIRVHRKRRRLDEGGTLRGFCYRIATNYALNHMRDRGLRRKREQEAAEMRKPEVTDPRNVALANEAWRLAEELPEVQRATLHLRYAQGLTIAETARALGVPEGTASTHQRKGLEALRKRLALTLAVVAPAVGLGQLMSAHQPAGTVASASTVSRIGATVMASTTTQAVSNTTILAILALLLAAGGVTIAIVAVHQKSPDVQVATTAPIKEEATESPQPVPEPDDESQPVQPEEASTTEPETETVEKVEQELTQDLDLLEQLRAHYEAGDREAFFKTEDKCKAAQPWDLEVLLPFFRKVVDAKLKRWHVQEYLASDINLERALFGLVAERLKSGASFSDVVSWFNDLADTYMHREARTRLPSHNESHADTNPDGDALGYVAMQLVRLRGYAKTKALIKNIFNRTELRYAVRYARIQIVVCDGLAEHKVEEAYTALEQLYLTTDYRPVNLAAYKALLDIYGAKYVQIESDRLVELVQQPEFNDWDSLENRLISLIFYSPDTGATLDAAERVFSTMSQLDIPLRRVVSRYTHSFEWRYHYQLSFDRDEKLTVLKHFDRTDSIGMVSALLLVIGDGYAETNSLYAKQALLDKAKRFEELGWTTDFRHGTVLVNLYFKFVRVSNDLTECLNVLTDQWYPTMQHWALRHLDICLFHLAEGLAARTPGWNAAHNRTLDLVLQRVEGEGEFGYDKRTDQLDRATKALVALDRPEVRAALVDKVAEVEDENLRGFYEATLIEWDHYNGQ